MRARGWAGEEAVANCVEQVGFALTGRSLEVERRELGLFGRGHTLGCIAGEHVCLAGDEGLERQRRVKANA